MPRDDGDHRHHEGLSTDRRAESRTAGTIVALIAFIVVGASATPAAGQQPVRDVLSFLLTNRSISTGDFIQDERAAAATRDTISSFLQLERASLPVTSSASAFTYRLDPSLGTFMRSSDSFGPFFTERSLTSGELKGSLGLSYQNATLATVDGRSLQDGTLIATASRLRGDTQPFDVEAVSLDIHTNTVTLLGNLGVTDRLDIGAALPFVALSLDGRRVDTYRGTQFVQAIASASASGPGDFLIRAKYNVVRGAESGLAIGAEARLPTGDEENLLGAGKASIKPRLVASLERGGVAVHGDVGYSVGGLSDELAYSGAITVLGTPRLTLVGEIAGRRLASAGRLTEITESHPLLVGVETLRLTSVQRAAERIVAVVGFKWNIAATLILSANVVRPVTTAGLNAHWISSFTLDYSFEP